jgi:beta-lactamase class A
MNKKILVYILPISTLIIGIFIGKLFLSKSPKKNKEATAAKTTESFTHINPLLDCIDSRKLIMKELDLFKTDITNYIDNVKKIHPDIHISYYFRDLNNGLWIGINEKEKFVPASLMKVPIMISVLKEAQTNKDILNTEIQYIAADFANVDEESGFKKTDGKFYTIEEYIRQMIVYSDNASAVILMKYVGMDKIAKTEDDLNLTIDANADLNTNFVSVTRYASILRMLYNASYLDRNMSEKALKILTETAYKGGIRAGLPNQYQLAHKYGERDFIEQTGARSVLQLHHFGIVYYPGKPYLLGIMTRGADKKTKEKIITDLAKITFDQIDSQMLALKKNDLATKDDL